jgi:hypothetical protein
MGVTITDHAQLEHGNDVRRVGPQRLLAGALVVAIGVLAVAGFLLYRELQPPTVTCSTSSAAACHDTRISISDRLSRDLVFTEPLPARLVAVDVRDAPPDWSERADFPEDGWAALLTMEGREPVLVACGYFSDDMVSCDDP